MCNFSELLRLAQDGDTKATQEILKLIEPLLKKNSIVQNRQDEDLYQNLILSSLKAIMKFDKPE